MLRFVAELRQVGVTLAGQFPQRHAVGADGRGLGSAQLLSELLQLVTVCVFHGL